MWSGAWKYEIVPVEGQEHMDWKPHRAPLAGPSTLTVTLMKQVLFPLMPRHPRLREIYNRPEVTLLISDTAGVQPRPTGLQTLLSCSQHHAHCAPTRSAGEAGLQLPPAFHVSFNCPLQDQGTEEPPFPNYPRAPPGLWAG